MTWFFFLVEKMEIGMIVCNFFYKIKKDCTHVAKAMFNVFNMLAISGYQIVIATLHVARVFLYRKICVADVNASAFIWLKNQECEYFLRQLSVLGYLA